MGRRNNYAELGDYVSRLIGCKAAEIIKLEGFSPLEYDDIQQDLALEILRRRPKFTSKRGSFETFATRIVDHAITDMVDKRWALMRNPRRCECSLNELVPDGEGDIVERAENLDYETYRRPSAPRTEEELQELRQALEEVLGSLPPTLRHICDLLAEGRSLPEIATLTGVSARTVYRARDRIRERFSRAGLNEYLGRIRGKISRRSGT
ncbi:MAG: sigma-70 family RNA polymerase sigma factor [Planctomycetota bacterium]